MEMYEWSYDATELIVSIGLPLIMTLVVLALSTLAGEPVARRFWALWRGLRPHVDEPSDPLIRLGESVIEVVTKTDIDREKFQQAVLAMYDAAKPLEGVPLAVRPSE